ncbi:KR domain-containing protein [Streptomyces eurocidicus]|uniref:NAD(P)-dependent dehydrogenase (Short-subunit alcohol dehydrogenase family) n=1 Tax=Streptomyces eurocidicus TaxID=66423 RepID=A0A7W8BB34_STREU|nr:KR domain-containing protein [Streptomyces eurocidicus]MBB5120127.1 NAD(P)-dependent dehydrogenase (short-subunit alcohol dehydrogenase family) [Streptomyces eurocidicus]MBF6056446.1 KR domain-containing protein [Streptomyces eurocidicus]
MTEAAVAPVRRMVWRAVAQAGLPPEPSARLRGARIVVLGGTPELAGRVAGELRAAGATAVVAGHGEKDDDGSWTVGGRVPDGLVDLTTAEPFVPGGHHGYRDALLRSVAALRACYPHWSATEDADRVFYVAVTYLGGLMGYGDPAGEAPAQPLGGIWAGLAKTLHRELPNCNTRVLDVAPEETGALPSLLARELYRWGLYEVGHRAGRRYSLLAQREEPGPRTVRLTPEDLVLVSGGGRGIGFEFAKSLAEEFGCRVVVTGRQRLPEGTEPWAGLTDQEFKGYERDRLVHRAADEGLADVRADLARVRSLRDLARNMAEVTGAGLDVVYERCDFTAPGQVADLLGRLGRPLTGVIHNAGVDTPVRLPKKTDEEFLRTVSTKVDSFVTLFQQVRGLPLKFFCNVGSLTGRLGGMTGQLDYGAANDGLARLGLWARHQVPFPVTTLCWPTWDRVGMIANFEATLRYMTALDVDEGIRCWQTELVTGASGEIGFVGPLGRALGPLQARGYPAAPDLPGFAELLPRIFHLGEPHTQVPGRSLTATVALDRSVSPVLGDFLVGGDEAVPVSLMLENAVRAASWLEPDGGLAPGPLSVEDLAVRVGALRLAGPGFLVRRETAGRYEDGRWVVDVRYRATGGPGTGDVLARLRVVHDPERAEEAGPAVGTAAAAAGDSRHLAPGNGPLRWRGLVLPLARWSRDAVGGHLAELRESVAGDLWTAPSVPASRLPWAALENIWRHTARHAPAVDLLTVARLDLARDGEATAARVRLHGGPDGRDWRVADAADGRTLLRVTGLAWAPADRATEHLTQCCTQGES